MAEDIGAELLEKIRAEFNEVLQKKDVSDYICRILTSVDNGTATMNDVALFSRGVGYRLSEIIAKHITPENLPDGRLYYNIANTILSGTLRDNYELINQTAANVQRRLDKDIGISIKPQKAPFPTERVHAIVGAVSDETADWDTIRRRLDAPVKNVTESMYNDYVEENAKFRHKAGLEAYIVRDDHGGCCEWCAKLVGKYRYPDEVPKDVYRRHDNCGCTVTYQSEKGFQNVWSKEQWKPSEEELERMRDFDPKITKLTPEQAAEREMAVKEKYAGKRVDKSVKSGIIESDRKSEWDNDLPPRGQLDILFTDEDGKDLYEFVANELKITESQAVDFADSVMGFTDDFYSDIRAYQRGEISDNDIQTMSDNIEKYIKKAPRWNAGTTFRGISISDDELNSYTSGYPIKMGGTASWTNQIDIAEDFASRQTTAERPNSIIYHCETQSKGTGIKHISVFGHESEVLCSKESRYVIDRIEGEYGTYHVYLREVE